MPAWLGWIAVVLLSLYLAVYPALAAWGAWLVSTRVAPAKAGAASGVSSADGLSPIATPAFAGATLSFILGFAALWTLTEWLRSWVFTGFAWNPLVVTIGDFFGLLRLTGTYGGVALFHTFMFLKKRNPLKIERANRQRPEEFCVM